MEIIGYPKCHACAWLPGCKDAGGVHFCERYLSESQLTETQKILRRVEILNKMYYIVNGGEL